jgi:hypothetical protein
MFADSPFHRTHVKNDGNTKLLQNSIDLLNYPIDICYDNLMGLHLRANRKIAKGQVVLKECPLAMAISDDYRLEHCSICTDKLENNSRVLCEACNSNNYLVDLAQFFKHSGIVLTGSSEVSLYAMFFRLFLGYSLRRSNSFDDDVISLPPDAISLLAWDKLGVEDDLTRDVSNISNVIMAMFEDFDVEQIQNACYTVVCNQHSVMNERGKEIGRSICGVSALFNHSCDSNLSWEIGTNTLGIMICKAIRDIEAGEELTISYINPELLDKLSAQERYNKILCELNFPCSCFKCKVFCKECFIASSKMKSCSRCHSVVYCSRECQVKNWSIHKLICGKLVKYTI